MLPVKTGAAYCKSYAGCLAAIPDGWHPTFKFLRSNYWQTGDDGGPRLQAFAPGPDGIKDWAWAVYHDKTHPIDGWATEDTVGGVIFFERAGKRYAGVVLHKGTPPGWYGSADGKDSSGNPEVGYGGVPDQYNLAKGRHAFPYRPIVQIYTWESLLAVMSGGVPTWSPVPVETVELMNFARPLNANLHGSILVGNRLMVTEADAVNTKLSGTSNKVNLLHCYKVN